MMIRSSFLIKFSFVGDGTKKGKKCGNYKAAGGGYTFFILAT
jgi:hypothetical protein